MIIPLWVRYVPADISDFETTIFPAAAQLFEIDRTQPRPQSPYQLIVANSIRAYWS